MAIPHYVYLLLKMPGNNGVLSLRGDLLKSFECDKEVIDHASTVRVPSSVSKILATAKELSLNKDSMPSKKPSQSSVKPAGDMGTKTIQLQEGDDSKTAIIGAVLGDKKELELVNFLRANRDVFTWKPVDMPGVPKELIEHALKVDPKATPKK